MSQPRSSGMTRRFFKTTPLMDFSMCNYGC
jgi:hypothetical protein